MILVMQGLPGAGKSTFASMLPHYTIVGADREVEAYATAHAMTYDQARIRLGAEAHQRCLRKFAKLVMGDDVRVIVDNTNTTAAEVAPYVALAQAFGHEVRIVHVVNTAQQSEAHNMHGVPTSVIERMAANLAAFDPPPWWPRDTVTWADLCAYAETFA